MCEYPSPSTAKSKLPGMTYTHLTRDERYQIAILAKAGHDQSEIADVMNRHRSTISRELRRNRGQRGYRPKQAHEFSQARMRACENGPRISDATWALVDARLGELWSPEQICGRLKERGLPSASHEAIYQRIYTDQRNGGTLHRVLRCQKVRRKRYGGRERRGTIPNRVSIEQRPAIVDTLKRFGDWEADLVIGAGQQQALVTLNQRKSRYALIAQVPLKTAQAVSEAMISLLTPFALCAYADDRQRQGVRPASAHRQRTRGRLLLRPSVRLLGARRQREHEWPHPPVLPEENALPGHYQERHRFRHEPTESPSPKMPRLQVTPRGIYEAATLAS